jgi:hypothetical protein
VRIASSVQSAPYASANGQAGARVRTREIGLKLGGFGITYTAREMDLGGVSLGDFARSASGPASRGYDATGRATAERGNGYDVSGRSRITAATPAAQAEQATLTITSSSGVPTVEPLASPTQAATRNAKQADPARRTGLSAYERALRSLPEDDAIPLKTLLAVV